MRLITEVASEGDWVVIQGGAPNPADLSIQYVQFGARTIAAYVDGNDLRFRCPEVRGDYADISVKGADLGRVQLLG